MNSDNNNVILIFIHFFLFLGIKYFTKVSFCKQILLKILEKYLYGFKKSIIFRNVMNTYLKSIVKL